MKLITLYLPETYIRALDQLVAERFFPNRAEAIRAGVRDMLVEFAKFSPPIKVSVPSVAELSVSERDIHSRRAPWRALH